MSATHVEIVHGDMLDLLPKWHADGFRCDTVITDAPYHLSSITKRFGKPGAAPAKHGKDGAAARLSKGFMNWDGDAGDVAFRPETWRACFDVLKPGGRLAAFGGTRTFWRMAAAIDAAGFEYEDTIAWVYGQGLVLRKSRLKPAFEPILLFRKPGPRVLDLNIDECRVPIDVEADKSQLRTLNRGHRAHDTASQKWGLNKKTGDMPSVLSEQGRWSPNFCHDGSEAVIAEFPEAVGQLARTITQEGLKTNNVYGALNHSGDSTAPRNDGGSAARFFTRCEFSEEEKRLYYVPKAPASERVYRCTLCGDDIYATERDAHMHGRETQDHLESHPTLKPVSLMKHLTKLLCPAGGLVLDPFAGSGTTAVAAVATGRNAVCIEKSQTYTEQGRKRVIDTVASLR